MKFSPVLLGLTLCLHTPISAQFLIRPELNLLNDPDCELTWQTRSGFSYRIETSLDLDDWMDLGVSEPGNDNPITYMLNCPLSQPMFFRVRETGGGPASGFLPLPSNSMAVNLVDGVPFALDLNELPALPEKITIEYRTTSPTGPWNLIGSLTDLEEDNGLRFVRGSTVWLPEAAGIYEVRVRALPISGAPLAEAERTVFVDGNRGPLFPEIIGGISNSNFSRDAAFDMAGLIDPEGDAITKIEFFDHDVFIGEDVTPPFDSAVAEDLELNFTRLRGGLHSIKARIHDARGAVVETPSYEFTIGGNQLPTLELTSGSDYASVPVGQSFTISYLADDPDGTATLDRVEVKDVQDSSVVASDSSAPFTALTINTIGWVPGSYTLRVEARDSSGAASYPVYARVDVQETSGPSFAEQLATTLVDGTSVQLVPGTARFTGIQASSGIFTGGINAGLEIDSGVLLTSGSFRLWNGGDVGGDLDDPVLFIFWDERRDPFFPINRVEPGDQLLSERVAGVFTSDAAILECEVLIQNSQLELEYQFGSEEYIEWVSEDANSGCFNDAFLITLTPIGRTAETIITLTPDAADIVGVNSIHPEILAGDHHFDCPVGSLDARRAHLYLDDDVITPIGGADKVEYDGMTIRLKSHALVAPGNYRLRISIGDVYVNENVPDDGLDSGVFISDSLQSVNPSN